MPLLLASEGDSGLVKKVNGNPSIRKHLSEIGFVVGSEICVISKDGGNMIVSVKGSRLAVTRELARKIMI